MSDKNNGCASCDADSMIENAKSLQRVVKELEKNGYEAGQSDYGLFRGMFWRVQFYYRSRQRSH